MGALAGQLPAALHEPERSGQDRCAGDVAAVDSGRTPVLKKIGNIRELLPVLELRQICSRSEDYANVIVRTAIEPAAKRRGACVVGTAA